MKINNDLVNQSDLLAIIVEKITTYFSDDISLLICYGSFVTGEYGGMSDIDFFFVPKTEKGFELGHQFILNNIGYDLWPVSWDRLMSIANLEDHLASILLDGVMVFASSEVDERRLEGLKADILQNLKDETVARRMSLKYLDEAKVIYFDLQNQARDQFFIDAIRIVEKLLVAVSILNGAYLRKGLKRVETEFERLSRIPDGFLEDYHKLIHATDQTEIQPVVRHLITVTDQLWKSKFESTIIHLDPADLTGFYEEFKSAYNKLLVACDDKNYESAYYAGFMIDRETLTFLKRFTGPGIFPNILDVVVKNDFEIIRMNCREHERKLLKLLEEQGVKINIYEDMPEFRKRFLIHPA